MNNSAEGFGFFAAAVLANMYAYSMIAAPVPDRVVALAGTIIGCRVLFTGFYLLDVHAARSTCFFIQAVCNIWLFVCVLPPSL